MTADAVLRIDIRTGLYDISIDDDGGIEVDDFFDTAILYSIYGERRANEREVVPPNLRRGWIGNIHSRSDFENGSKLWLFEQARLNRSIMNRIADEARKALQWLVDDGLAESIDGAEVITRNGIIFLSVTIRRSNDRIDNRLFDLWENTGVIR